MIGTLAELKRQIGEIVSVERAKPLNRLIAECEEEYWKLLSEHDSLEEELSEARAQPVEVRELVDVLAQWARSADKRDVERVTGAIAAGLVGGAWPITGEVPKP